VGLKLILKISAVINFTMLASFPPKTPVNIENCRTRMMTGIYAWSSPYLNYNKVGKAEKQDIFLRLLEESAETTSPTHFNILFIYTTEQENVNDLEAYAHNYLRSIQQEQHNGTRTCQLPGEPKNKELYQITDFVEFEKHIQNFDKPIRKVGYEEFVSHPSRICECIKQGQIKHYKIVPNYKYYEEKTSQYQKNNYCEYRVRMNHFKNNPTLSETFNYTNTGKLNSRNQLKKPLKFAKNKDGKYINYTFKDFEWDVSHGWLMLVPQN
jgi:hypothetical protein